MARDAEKPCPWWAEGCQLQLCREELFGAGFPGHPRSAGPFCCPCHPPFCPALPALATPSSALPPLLPRSPLYGLQEAKKNQYKDGDGLGTTLPLLPACWLTLCVPEASLCESAEGFPQFFSSLWLKESALLLSRAALALWHKVSPTLRCWGARHPAASSCQALPSCSCGPKLQKPEEISAAALIWFQTASGDRPSSLAGAEGAVGIPVGAEKSSVGVFRSVLLLLNP